MIKKILIDKQSEEDYTKLSKERKDKYIEINHKLVCCPEEYIIGVDIASPYHNDMCALIYWRTDSNGKIEVKGIEYF